MFQIESIKKPHTVFAEYVEGEALAQFAAVMADERIVKGALMPDAHTGYTLPIGGVVETSGWAFPSFVGYDIGCGMCAIQLDKQDIHAGDIVDNAQAIFDEINKRVPVGFEKNKSKCIMPDFVDRFSHTGQLAKDMDGIGLLQIGTLGGGNHFIEIGFDESAHVWIIVHSGSRKLGHNTATRYMKLASPTGKASEGNYGFDVHNDSLGQQYMLDALFCQEYALENRKNILARVLVSINKVTGLNLNVSLDDIINRNHNHVVWQGENLIHRKGATHAEENMMGVIPGNMRDGSFIVRGKGNPDALWSSSHGAGRVLGRKKAKENLDITEFESTMEGIVANVQQSTLDESPMAYKNIFDVMEQQSSMVEIVAYVRPIVNVKG